MEERSKTNKEIFEELYPTETLIENPLFCAEAVGYLKAIIQYFPSKEKWAISKMTDLVIILSFHTLQ